MKKLSIVLLFLILISTITSSFAKNNPLDFTKYDGVTFTDIDEFPEGVVPLKINSQEELDAFVATISEGFKSINSDSIHPRSSGDYTSSTKSLDFTKYDGVTFTDIDEFPEGVVPLKINSQEELDDFVATVSEGFKSISSNSTHPRSSGDYTVKISEKTSLAGITTLTLYADIDYYHSNNFRKISGASNIYTTLTGLTVWNRWEERNTDYSILDNGKGIKVWADGTMHYYILNENFGKILSIDESVSTSYFVY